MQNYYFDLPTEIMQKIQKINLIQDVKNSHEIWWKLAAVKSQECKYVVDKEICYREYFDMPRLFNLVFDISKFEFNLNKIKQDFTIPQLQDILMHHGYTGKLPKQYRTLVKAFATI